MDHGQVCLGLLWVTIQHDGLVVVSERCEAIVTLPAIGPDSRTFRHVLFNERGEVSLAVTRHEAQPKSSSVYRTLKRLAITVGPAPFGGAIFSLTAATHLDGTNDCRLVVDTPTFATRAPAYERLVDLDRVLPANGVAVGSHHPGAQLVKGLERRLVPTNTELTLELEGRLPWRLGRHEVCAPKPQREWHMTGLHDGARRKRYIHLASAAPENDRCSLRETVRFANRPTFQAGEPVWPAQLFQIGRAGCIARENPLELWEVSREAA